MWDSKTKQDLIIEVWEKLDCEDVGRVEIEAIEIVVLEQFGKSAVESPMIIARQLADEGAYLRHSEIMELDKERRLDTPYAPMFRNLINISDLDKTLSSIRNLENLRKKFVSDNDKEGLRLLKETVLSGKKRASEISANEKFDRRKRIQNSEIAEWFTIWLGSPEVFENWVNLRKNSEDFKDKFGGE